MNMLKMKNTHKTKPFNKGESQIRCKKFRRKILDISQQVSALHGGGAFSALEMVDCIYYSLMRRNPDGSSPDTFIMSKGHSCLAQYVILEEMGLLSKNDLDQYCTSGGRLGCHPDYGNPGIEASTGSLGHGLGLAVGMTHADTSIRKEDRLLYLVTSDGELQEGSTWETMMMAANLELKNLIVFLDHNGSQSFGHTRETHPKFYPIKEKVEAFGWECVEVNGHDVTAIYDAVMNRKGDRPFMLVGNTVKGKGVSFMENQPIWHYRSPNKEEYIQAINELKEISS